MKVDTEKFDEIVKNLPFEVNESPIGIEGRDAAISDYDMIRCRRGLGFCTPVTILIGNGSNGDSYDHIMVASVFSQIPWYNLTGRNVFLQEYCREIRNRIRDDNQTSVRVTVDPCADFQKNLLHALQNAHDIGKYSHDREFLLQTKLVVDQYARETIDAIDKLLVCGNADFPTIDEIIVFFITEYKKKPYQSSPTDLNDYLREFHDELFYRGDLYQFPGPMKDRAFFLFLNGMLLTHTYDFKLITISGDTDTNTAIERSIKLMRKHGIQGPNDIERIHRIESRKIQPRGHGKLVFIDEYALNGYHRVLHKRPNGSHETPGKQPRLQTDL